MNQKRGNRSAGESGIGVLFAAFVIGAISRTPYAFDVATATAFTGLCTVLSSKLFGDRQ